MSQRLPPPGSRMRRGPLLVALLMLAALLLTSGPAVFAARLDGNIRDVTAALLGARTRGLLAVVPPPATVASCAQATKDGTYLLSITIPPAEVYCVAGTKKVAAQTYLKLPATTAADPAANVFTFSDIVKTTYAAVKIDFAADGSVTVDTTDKKFATTTFRAYPIKSYLVALNYASAATCAPLAPGTGVIDLTGTPFFVKPTAFGVTPPPGVAFSPGSSRVTLVSTDKPCGLIAPKPDFSKLPLDACGSGILPGKPCKCPTSCAPPSTCKDGSCRCPTHLAPSSTCSAPTEVCPVAPCAAPLECRANGVDNTCACPTGLRLGNTCSSGNVKCLAACGPPLECKDSGACGCPAAPIQPGGDCTGCADSCAAPATCAGNQCTCPTGIQAGQRCSACSNSCTAPLECGADGNCGCPSGLGLGKTCFSEGRTCSAACAAPLECNGNGNCACPLVQSVGVGGACNSTAADCSTSCGNALQCSDGTCSCPGNSSNPSTLPGPRSACFGDCLCRYLENSIEFCDEGTCPVPCFHGDSLLTLRHPVSGAAVPRRFAEAAPGDSILAVADDGKLVWSPVTVMKSFRPDLPAVSYLRVTTDAGQVLTVTPNHIMYRAPAGQTSNTTSFTERQAIAAGDLKVGDQMYVQPPGAMTVVASDIVSIRPLVLATAFNAHTVLGSAVVDGVVASNFGIDDHLPVADTFAVKHAAGAKMRLAYQAAPHLLRLLHTWRLLTPLHDGISAIGKQADIMAQSKSFTHRMAGRGLSFLWNRVPSALELALTRGSPSAGKPYEPHKTVSMGSDVVTVGSAGPMGAAAAALASSASM